MNRIQLIKALRSEEGISLKEATEVVDCFFNDMANALAKGGRVEIRRFCTFQVKKYKPYVGRNPKTGEKVNVRAKKLPFFKCGKGLKKSIN
jgi:integration host factor subunit beta